jgi:murein L,D-transpeptidase YafK
MHLRKLIAKVATLAALSEAGFRALWQEQHPDALTLTFWKNLHEGFALFEKEHKPLAVSVRGDGRYEFRSEISSGSAR